MSRVFDDKDHKKTEDISLDLELEDELRMQREWRNRPSPGKVSRTSKLQFRGGRAGDAEQLKRRAEQGAAGASEQLPHLELIQRAFGKYDVSDVKAHRGDASLRAAQELGADAYTLGDDVVFGHSDDLYTAAHEAAHVVQQRAGVVNLNGGVGRAGDSYEQHADAVADAVVSGRSAEPLLESMAGPSTAQASLAAPAGVQRREQPPFQLTEAEIQHGEIDLHVANADERGAAPGSAGDYIAGSNVQLSRDGDTVFLTAPLVTWRTEVSLPNASRLAGSDPDGGDPGDVVGEVLVGPIQVLNSSTRTGIYKDAAGNVVAERRLQVSTARDAMTGHSSRNNPPFYGDPLVLTAGNSSGSVQFYDSPMCRLPARMGNGTLKAMRGQDSFTLSLGAKHEETIIHIAPHNWTVPWDLEFDSLPEGDATQDGGEVDISDAPEGRTPPGGAIVADRSSQASHFHYPSAAAAAQVDYWTLVEQREAAERNDPGAASNIVAGMLLQNPLVRIKVLRIMERFSADDMVLHAWGAHRASRSADVTGEHIFDVRLRELFHNRSELTTTSNINLTLFDEDHDDGVASGHMAPVPYPFAPTQSTEITASGYVYRIQLLAFGSRNE